MTEIAWGEAAAVALVNFVPFAVATMVGVNLLMRRRWTGYKTILTSLVIAHFISNVLLLDTVTDNDAYAVGYTLSRILGIPLLWLMARRTIRRHELNPEGDDDDADDTDRATRSAD